MQAANALDSRLRAAVEAFEAGHLDRALKMAQQLCQSFPKVAIVHNVHGVIAAEKGAHEAAIISYRNAITLEPDNCDFHFNLGNLWRDKGDLKSALTSYRTALKIKPDDPDVLFNMATVLRGLGELGMAEKLFRQLVAASPNSHTGHNNLGGVLFLQGKTDDAADCFRTAIRLQPGFVEAHDNLCEVLEKTNQTEELRKAIAHARRVCRQDDIRIVVRQVQLLRRDKDLEGARDLLSCITNFHPGQARLNSAYWYLLGDICDRLEDSQAAYEAMVEANIWAAKAVGGRGLEPGKFIGRLDDLETVYKSVRRSGSTEKVARTDAPQLVFLVGFPRSGTTLLDTILLSHSRISVVEEKPLVHEMVKLAASWRTGGLPNHEDLTVEQINELRGAYMKGLDSHLPEPATKGDVVIDKLPLNIVETGLVSKVFPDAKFLLVLRHPCDCVLSCFMQDFRLNNAMANFLDLKSAALCYDKVMSLWHTYTGALNLPVHVVKYEQIVGDFAESVGEVLRFLELEWEDSMADYMSTAVDRKRIGTPSYHQVSQPIYSRAEGRWRRYRAHMVPVLPTLLKWAEIHGYSND